MPFVLFVTIKIYCPGVSVHVPGCSVEARVVRRGWKALVSVSPDAIPCRHLVNSPLSAGVFGVCCCSWCFIALERVLRFLVRWRSHKRSSRPLWVARRTKKNPVYTLQRRVRTWRERMQLDEKSSTLRFMRFFICTVVQLLRVVFFICQRMCKM